MPAGLKRIQRTPGEIDRRAAALGAHHERRPSAVAKEFDADGAVVEDIAFGPPRERARRASPPRRGRPASLACPNHDRDRSSGDGRDRCGIGQGQRLDGFGHRSASRERLRACPGLVPFRSARNIKGNQQGRPGAKAANAIGNGARAPVMAHETRGGFIRAIATEKRQIDEGCDPQAHMIEPNRNPQPVIRKQSEKHRQTELPEVGGALSDVGPDSDCGPNRAILVVPGRVRRLTQERIDDRGHPQSPAQHPHRLFDQNFNSAGADEVLNRPQAPLQSGVEQHVVDRE